MKKILSLICCSLVLALSGCASNEPVNASIEKSGLTHGNVQLNLKKGETTKAQVLDVFGAPNITTIDGAEREVWTYQKNASVSSSTSYASFGTVVLFGGSQQASGFEQSSKTITLIIKFDENDMVVDFKSRATSF